MEAASEASARASEQEGSEQGSKAAADDNATSPTEEVTHAGDEAGGMGGSEPSLSASVLKMTTELSGPPRHSAHKLNLREGDPKGGSVRGESTGP